MGHPVIRAIIGMANSLDMKVIAEGIETESQVDDLKKLDCDYGQGFLFNEPIDPVAAQDLIKEVYSRACYELLVMVNCGYEPKSIPQRWNR
jgi:EAL domain-containing protein (putative c-di-GMP-specific phosphodiesterase class I)